MESVEEVCDQIYLINHSEVVLEGNVAEIKQRFKKHLYEICLAGGEQLQPCEELFTIEEARPEGTTIIRLAQGVAIREVIARLNEQYALRGFSELLPTMHEIFIETVKNSSNNE